MQLVLSVILLSFIIPTPNFTNQTLQFKVGISGIPSVVCGNAYNLSIIVLNGSNIVWSRKIEDKFPLSLIESGRVVRFIKIGSNLPEGEYKLRTVLRYCNYTVEKTFTLEVADLIVESVQKTFENNEVNFIAKVRNNVGKKLDGAVVVTVSSGNRTLDRIYSVYPFYPGDNVVSESLNLTPYSRLSPAVQISVDALVGNESINIDKFSLSLKKRDNGERNGLPNSGVGELFVVALAVITLLLLKK